MNEPRDLLDKYRIALEDYLAGGGEASLARAYELGRQALADGLGILEMAQLHHSAALRVLNSLSTPGEMTRLVKAAADFFAECLSPFEMTHRGFQEANAVLRYLNEMLEELEWRVRQRTEELRESEEKYRALFENSRDAIYITTREGTILEANQAALDLFGYSREEASGRDVRDVYVHPGERQKFQEEIERKGSVRDYELKLRKKDGTEMDCLITATVRRGTGGVILGYQGVIRDITQRKRREEEIRKINSELAAVNKQLEAFTYSVSHDLRAPLRAVQGFSQALLEDCGGRLDPLCQDYARRVAAAAGRMDALIQDLLAYSRLSRVSLQLEPVALDSVMADVRVQLEAEIQGRGARVEIHEPLPKVLGHHATLVQVVSNLLTNAIKFVAPGVQPQVRVWAETQGAAVRVWVEDNGVGIAEEHQERIFEIFGRLHGSEYPGTGVGLAIVSKGLERLGGQVGVCSAPNQGSKFWVQLLQAGSPS